MLIDRSHRTWAFLSAVILAVATVSYVFYAGLTPKGPTGGSFMGLVYGIVGSLMMIFAGLLAGRKQFPLWRLGSAQFWLRGHLWLGTLSVPLILFHSGFGLGGRVEQLLWLFFAIVVLSGFFGLAMQHLLPRLMAVRIPRETFPAQIPYVRKRSRVLADKLISAVCGRVPLENDPLADELTHLAHFAADLKQREKSAKSMEEKSKIKGEKSNWTTRVDPGSVTLFQDLAIHAKNEGWIRTEDDFSGHLLEVYQFSGIALDEPDATTSTVGSGATPATAITAKPDVGPAAKPLSPLEQMKARQAAASPAGATPATDKPAGAPAAPGGAALSPLEMIKAKQAAKAAEAASAGNTPVAEAPAAKPLSPLEQIKAKQAAKAQAVATEASTTAEPSPPAPASESKSASPLDKVRAMQAAKTTGAGSDPASVPKSPLQMVKEQQASKPEMPQPEVTDAAPAAPATDAIPAASKPLSPLEQIKAKQAAKTAEASSSGTPAETKPLSPLEQMKARQAAKAAGDANATPAPAASAEKPKSPLDMLKAKGAAGATAAKPAASAPAPAPVPIKKSAVKMPLLRVDELRTFYLGTVRPYLVGNGRSGRLADVTESSRAFTHMRATLPVELHDLLHMLEVRCDEHRQFAIQERLHHWLHYWLALHIPFSLGLAVLFVVHVLISLRVVPWSFPFRM